MADNKQNKRPNVPPLRFPEFTEPWERKTFGECCSPLEYGMNAAAKEFDGNNKYIRITDIDETTSTYSTQDVVSPSGVLEDKYLVCENDILFARTGASVGKTYHYDKKDGKLYYAGFLIRANVLPCNNSKFIFYQTQLPRYKKWVKIMSARSGQPGINSLEFQSFNLFIPARIEQDKIVSFINLLDRRIEVQSKLIEDLKQLKSAICKKLLSHSSWNEYIIDDICDSVSFKEYIAEVEENGSFPIIQQGETPILGYGNKKPYYNYNSVIIFGDHTLSLYKPQVPFLVATDGVKMLSPKPFVTRDFLYYLIETFMPISQGYKRHFSILKEQIVRLPSLKEQTIIGKRLSLLDTKIRIEQQLYDCYISQKQYLLGQMFI